MKRLFFAILLGGILTGVPEVSSNTFPHFPYKGVEGAVMVHKQQKKTKKTPEKTISKDAAQAITPQKYSQEELDSIAIAQKSKQPNSLAKSLNEVCSMITHLGNMPSGNPRERSAKLKYREKIESRVSELIYAYPKQSQKLQAIIYRIQTDLVLGNPDDDKDVIGRVRERGSRFHCAKIVSFIKSIINQL